MVFAAGSTTWPVASVYGPLGSAADCSVTADGNADNVDVLATAIFARVLPSRVTAPVRARSRPSTAAPVVAVMEAQGQDVAVENRAVPMVAELPTCQKILEALAAPVRMIWRPEVMVKVEAIWKMKTALGSPCASRVRSPEEMASEEVDL